VSTRPWVLGYSASHNGAVCLLHGDEVVVAVQEERLNGTKRARISRLEDSLALKYCLEYAQISVEDLVAIVGCCFSGSTVEGASIWRQGWPGQFLAIPHHLGHAIGAFVQSGFADAAVLVVDGQGGDGAWLPESERRVAKIAEAPGRVEANEIISIYEAGPAGLSCTEKHLGQWITDPQVLGTGAGLTRFGSLGGMFSAASDFIFGYAMDAGKVMGLAAYGEPRFPVADFFSIRDDGGFDFSEKLPRQMSAGRRWPDDQKSHSDLAASVQQALEEGMFHLVRRCREQTTSRNLCLVGGCALNNVANEKIIAMQEFDRVFIMPAAEDSGPAIGAAYHGLWALEKNRSTRVPVRRIVHDAPGRKYSASEIQKAIDNTPVVREVETSNVIDTTIDMLCAGKVVGWFQGGSELGPRALGQRSIIADARRKDAKDILNLKVKHREAFRPFAPVILEEKVGEWFQLPANDPTSPFMLRTFDFHPDKIHLVPSVVHKDGSGRLQTLTAQRNGLFYELVKRFDQRTGVPIIINTSFNVMGEPIVETPEDALFGLLYTALDAVVLEDRILVKPEGFSDIRQLYPNIIAQAVEIERSLTRQLDEKVTVLVEKHWGKARYPIPPAARHILERINGQINGHEIFRGLSGTGLLESAFVDAMRHLRRTGVIAFRSHAWVG
jgi:carbamoyltransferase